MGPTAASEGPARTQPLSDRALDQVVAATRLFGHLETPTGIAAGRDEVLEKAVEWLRKELGK